MAADIRLSQRVAWSEGQPISDLMSRALANPDLISLAAGFVDQQSLPVEATGRALDALWRDQDAAQAALQYGTTPGFPPLREAILARCLRADGQGLDDSGVSIEQTVITAGSNQLLHLIGESLLDPGDFVLCAAPTYLVFLGTLANLGARAVGIATDPFGVIPAALEDELRHMERMGQLPRVKAIYLVSYFDNPCGVTMPATRRAEIVQIAKRWSTKGKIHIIEDVAYRDLRYEGADVPSLRSYDPEGETVILAGTFSKCFSPGIRVGWGILPRHLVPPVCNQKGNIDFGSPNFNQHLMAKVLELDLLDGHIQHVRASYQEKRDAMLSAADRWLSRLPALAWMHPHGGLYVWAEVPESIDTGPGGALFDRSIQEGVLYVPGQFCYAPWGQPVPRNRMRLSFGVQSTDRIERGIAALARAVEHVLA
jgi:2-aminoadipate transaminase